MAKQSKNTPSEEKICFVVMPFGRTEEAKRWFRGWYREVIEKAVEEAGYKPVLGALENTPSAINDDIRKHLAFDDMVVVDLGGMTPEDEPNPNVMYELGIRHAFNLPLVLMGWKDQKLPFDINNQRAIMEGREVVDFEVNREKLRQFIKEAEAGRYYKPMDAVGRSATLERAGQTLGQDDVLKTLIEEVQGLGDKIEQSQNRRPGSLPSIPAKRPFDWDSFVEEVSAREKLLGDALRTSGYDFSHGILTVIPEISSQGLLIEQRQEFLASLLYDLFGSGLYIKVDGPGYGPAITYLKYPQGSFRTSR